MYEKLHQFRPLKQDLLLAFLYDDSLPKQRSAGKRRSCLSVYPPWPTTRVSSHEFGRLRFEAQFERETVPDLSGQEAWQLSQVERIWQKETIPIAHLVANLTFFLP